MRFIFNKGPLFYAFYNIRLFFYLLFSKADIFHANDLDTLWANHLAAVIRKKKLVYDSHELFTEVPELISRPRVRNIWKRIEKRIFPKLKYIFTVNESIANIFQEKYGVKVHVLRNLPYYNNPIEKKSRSFFGLDETKKIVILQGAGINIDRGAEELVEAMKFLDEILLVIAGDGDIIPELKQYVNKEQLSDKVRFFPKMPHEQLMQLTACADCGVTLDKDTNLNYRYSLPNKLFDYIRAEIPVLSSSLPEIQKIIEQYKVGIIIESHDPQLIATKLKTILFDYSRDYWTNSLVEASKELCWENEQQKLIEIYEQIR